MCARRLVCGALLALLAGSEAGAGVTEWIPIEVSDGQVLFPVEIAGRPGKAMFDSGSMGNAVSRDVVAAAKLRLGGRKWNIRGVGSTEERVGSVSRLPIELFGVGFELQDVPAMPQNVDLIIGAGFLRAIVLQLDYPNHRMRLITHESVDLSKSANVEMHPARDTGLPAVRVVLDGQERWMMLDTGNAGPILMRRLVATQAGWLERFKRAESSLVDVNANESQLDILVLPSLKLGPYELENVPVAIPAEGEDINISGSRLSGPVNDSRIRSGVRVSGVLGYEVLRHFVVTIDYEREKMHVGLPAAPAEPERAPAPPTSASASEKP